jgi:hypothetical protein
MAAVAAMTGPAFEWFVAGLLRELGWRNVRVVGGAGDGGVDTLATDPGGVLVAVQCKRQVGNVGVQVVRQLIGSVGAEHKGRTPYLVTTAALTNEATALAVKAGVRVIDGRALGTWVAVTGCQPDGQAAWCHGKRRARPRSWCYTRCRAWAGSLTCPTSPDPLTGCRQPVRISCKVSLPRRRPCGLLLIS